MIGTHRAGVRYLGAVVAGIMALSLYGPLVGARADTPTAPTATCTCSITLKPVSGPRGTSVTVTGTGFAHSATVTLEFVDAALARTTLPSAKTGNHGNFTATIVIPNSAALGHGFVVANTGTLRARAPFLVKRSCTTKAAMTLNPTSGPAGSSVVVSGSGFCPSTRVRIRFRDSNLTWTLLAQGVLVGLRGNFRQTETIPADAALGDGFVAVYDASSAQGTKETFTVTT